VASLRQRRGIGELQISHIANPTLDFDTPSRRIEFYSRKAETLGLPALPTFTESAGADGQRTYPLLLAQGRTLTHFHSFYNNGRELPTLARREKEPQLWLAPSDAAVRQVADGTAIRVFNQRGSMTARAHVTERMPPGTAWVRDGWQELNQLTGGDAVLPDHAVEAFSFSAGQSAFDARVEVVAL
jgi:anaerobic selenocysteine-containing dehydrogenase